jgi:hypothetical protein
MIGEKDHVKVPRNPCKTRSLVTHGKCLGQYFFAYVYEQTPALTSLYTAVHTTSANPERNLLIYRPITGMIKVAIRLQL